MKDWTVVTGDSSGLGEVIVSLLLDKGYPVIGISRSQTTATRKRLENGKDTYKHVNFDLSNVDSLKALYTTHLKKCGPISGLVNNAAIAYDDLVTNANHGMLESMFKVNVIAPILMTKYAIRDMLLNGVSGSIVHVSSVSAHTGFKGLSMYAATKSALEGFSRSVAREWGEKGIRSNCVSPGFMVTRMSSKLTSEQMERVSRRTCLKAPTEQESVANVIEFLLSNKSSSITGQTILVDAGYI